MIFPSLNKKIMFDAKVISLKLSNFQVFSSCRVHEQCGLFKTHFNILINILKVARKHLNKVSIEKVTTCMAFYFKLNWIM